MTWFVRTVYGQFSLPAALILGAASGVLHDLAIAIPVIGPGTPFGDIPVSALAPLALVIVIGTLQRGASPGEVAAACRGIGRMLLLFGVVACALFIAGNAAVAAAMGTSALDIVRNTCGYFALLLIGQTTVGLRLAPMVPALYLFLSTIFGRAPDGSAQPWAWPVVPAHLADLLVAIAIVTALASFMLLKPAALRTSFRFA